VIYNKLMALMALSVIIFFSDKNIQEREFFILFYVYGKADIGMLIVEEN